MLSRLVDFGRFGVEGVTGGGGALWSWLGLS